MPPRPEPARLQTPGPAGGLLGAQTLTDSFLVFLPLSLLAKKCPRIMKRAIYSSDVQSGAFWNELATGECLSVFSLFVSRAADMGVSDWQGPEESPRLRPAILNLEAVRGRPGTGRASSVLVVTTEAPGDPGIEGCRLFNCVPVPADQGVLN